MSWQPKILTLFFWPSNPIAVFWNRAIIKIQNKEHTNNFVLLWILTVMQIPRKLCQHWKLRKIQLMILHQMRPVPQKQIFPIQIKQAIMAVGAVQMKMQTRMDQMAQLEMKKKEVERVLILVMLHRENTRQLKKSDLWLIKTEEKLREPIISHFHTNLSIHIAQKLLGQRLLVFKTRNKPFMMQDRLVDQHR